MPEARAIVGSRRGLHGRSAAVIASHVSRAGVPVTIGRPGAAEVSAADVLAVLGEGLIAGEEVVVRVEEGHLPASETASLLAALVRDIESELDPPAG